MTDEWLPYPTPPRFVAHQLRLGEKLAFTHALNLSPEEINACLANRDITKRNITSVASSTPSDHFLISFETMY